MLLYRVEGWHAFRNPVLYLPYSALPLHISCFLLSGCACMTLQSSSIIKLSAFNCSYFCYHMHDNIKNAYNCTYSTTTLVCPCCVALVSGAAWVGLKNADVSLFSGRFLAEKNKRDLQCCIHFDHTLSSEIRTGTSVLDFDHTISSGSGLLSAATWYAC